MEAAAASAPTVAQLREGAEVDGVFACVRKDRLTARTGTPYLAIELRDGSGAIGARAFRDADFHAARFERGDLVRVRGRVDRFRDELQVEVSSIERVEGAPEAFLPTAYRDLDELDGFLEHLAGQVAEPGLAALLDAFLADSVFRAGLRRAPCTRGGHHAYLGGLLEHTVAVATLAVETADLHRRLRRDLLLAAAILHDAGKTLEFDLTGAAIALSPRGRMVGHLVLGERLIAERVARVGLAPEVELELLHCVLGHHGPDALPGRRFASAEALALFRLNALDAQVKGALEHGLQ